MMDNTCVCCGAAVPEGRMVCPGCETAAKEMGRYRKKVADDSRRIEELEAKVAAFLETMRLYEWFVAATLRVFGADRPERAVELPVEQVMDLSRGETLRIAVDQEKQVWRMWGAKKE